MFFNKTALLILVVTTTVSCSYFFKESQKESSVQNLSLNEKSSVACVKDNNRLLKDYFALNGDNETLRKELVQMKGCLNEAILLFSRHTKAVQGDAYAPDEIHRFLSSIFASYSFPVSFMEDAFLLKNSLIGGGIDSVTKAEINKLPIYINFIYDALAEHVEDRHFLFSKEKSKDFAGFLKASQRFENTILKIQNLPLKKSGLFDYDALARLISYFLDASSNTSDWQKTFKLVNSLQALLSAGQKDVIEIQKVPSVLAQLSQLYLSYIEFNKFLKDDVFYKDLSTVFTFPGLITRVIAHPDVFSNENVESLSDIQRRILSTFKRATEETKEGKISLSYLSDLINTLYEIGSFPSYIKPQTLQSMMPNFFGFWLTQRECSVEEPSRARNIPMCDLQSLTTENIVVLNKIVRDWKERQLWINTTFPREDGKVYTHLNRDKSKNNNKKSSAVRSFESALQAVNHVHWEDYVVIGEKKFNYKDVVIFNKIYSLAEIFTRPFNKNFAKKSILDYFLTKNQAQYFYEWLRPLALELKLADPRSRNSGELAFTEINLFASMADEPEKMNFAETIEYFEIAISTSLRSVSIMENEFKDCQIKDGPTDVFGYYRLDAGCYRNEFFAEHEKMFFSTLPKLKKYLANNESARALVLNYLERAGRQGLILDEPIETDVFRFMGSIIQYAESLFLRYDRDENDAITTEEFKRALAHLVPNIRPVIQASLDPSQKDKLYKAIPNFEEVLLTYIIKNQKLPKLLTYPGELSFVELALQLRELKKWSEELPSWLTRAEIKRESIVLVISALSSFSRVNRIKAIRKLFVDHELEFDKGLTQLSDPNLVELSKLLQCSTDLEMKVRQWLVDNQDKYWKESRRILQMGTGSSTIEVKSSNLPNFLTDWQGTVTKTLLNLIKDEPSLGPLCSLPFLDGVNRVSHQQDVHVRECASGALGMGGVCVDKHRTPY